MLKLSKEIIHRNPVIKNGKTILLGKRTYKIVLSQYSGFYLEGIGYSNDQMFRDLHIQNKKAWCEENGIQADTTGIFPYMDGPNLSLCIRKLQNLFLLQRMQQYNHQNKQK